MVDLPAGSKVRVKFPGWHRNVLVLPMPGPSGGPLPDMTGVPAGQVPVTLGGGGAQYVAFDWTNLAGKPATFPTTWADVADKPTTFTPAAHNHAAADINSGTLNIARVPTATSRAVNATSVVRADDTRLTVYVANSAALPATGTTYQRAVTTDNGREYRWTGSAWTAVQRFSGGLSPSLTSDASAKVVLTHNLGYVPTAFIVQAVNSNYYAASNDPSATTTTVDVFIRAISNGATVPSTSIGQLKWFSIE